MLSRLRCIFGRSVLQPERLSKARWRAWMYPEGARELELKLENDFGQAAMHVACAYLFQQVFTYCCSLLHKCY